MLKRNYLPALAAMAISFVAGSLVSGSTPGSVDEEFVLPLFNNNDIQAMTLDQDGRLLVVGSFTDVGPRITAILPDGSVDETFTPGSGPNSAVRAIAIDGQGMIYIGGDFTQYNGQPRVRMARLFPDGTLDPDFDPKVGFNASVFAIQPLPELGGVLVGGEFWQVQGANQNAIARLDEEGDLDPSFTSGAGSTVNDIVRLDDGRLVIGGAFTNYNGAGRNRIAVVNSDGTFANDFVMGSGFSATVTALQRTASNQILVAGSFASYNGTARNRLARLNGDGTLDESFDAGSGPNSTVNAIVEEAAGQIVIVGSFTAINSVSQSRIAGLSANGSLDPEFDVGSGAVSTINAIVHLATQERLVIGGVFTSYDGQFTGRLARIVGRSALVGDDYFSWISDFFPNAGGDVTLIGPQADPDGDGVLNLLEYAFGGNPQEASRALLPTVNFGDTEGESHLGISFIRVRDAIDVSYRVEASPDLETWTEIWNSENFAYDSEEETAIETVYDPDPMNTSVNRFLRVNVLLEEAN
jgi:uncharacterized delta-60 repeat protein